MNGEFIWAPGIVADTAAKLRPVPDTFLTCCVPAAPSLASPLATGLSELLLCSGRLPREQRRLLPTTFGCPDRSGFFAFVNFLACLVGCPDQSGF